MPKEAGRLCLCRKCWQEDPNGRLVTAHTYRVHQLKRTFEEMDESDDMVCSSHAPPSLALPASYTAPKTTPPQRLDLPSGSSISPQQSSSASDGMQQDPSPSTTNAEPRPSDSSIIVDTRLEIQSIRYQHLSLRLTRPYYLEFASDIQVSQAEGYEYTGGYNQHPYTLIESPANAIYLGTEARLHSWVQQLSRLRAVSPESGFQLCVNSVEKNLIKSLNQMYQWKRELYNGQAKPASTDRPVVDTSRFSQIYNYGDEKYAPFVLAGLLLVLILHLLFNGSQYMCEIVLALIHDQVRNLNGLVNEERRSQMANSIPSSVKTVLKLFDLEGRFHHFIHCCKCFSIYRYPASPPTYPDICTNRETPTSQVCNGKMTRTHTVNGKVKVDAIRTYVHQDMAEWVGRFICRPEIESLIEERRQKYSTPKSTDGSDEQVVEDILGGSRIQSFSFQDGKPFFDCDNSEVRLLFALGADGFNPFQNRQAKQTASSTAVYLFCLNLPLSERYKPENVYLAGVIPGPGKPSTSEINHYISLIVDDFLVFWHTGVYYTRTSKRPDGLLVRAALMLVISDALAARQISGFGSTTSQFFCTFCWLPITEIENFNKASWPNRSLERHRYWAEQWNSGDASRREDVFDAHGIRYTPLLRLPYFDPIRDTVLDTMHNFYLGLLQRHCRQIWGMDLSIADGDGNFKPRGHSPPQPSADRMNTARRALDFNDIELLTKSRVDVLFYLCYEKNLRRGGRKRDLIRELIRWRKNLGAFAEPPIQTGVLEGANTPLPIPPSSGSTATHLASSTVSVASLRNAEQSLSHNHILDPIETEVLVLMCEKRGLPITALHGRQALINALLDWRTDQLQKSQRANAQVLQQPQISNTNAPSATQKDSSQQIQALVLPSEVKLEKLEAAESLLVRGYKLDSISKDVLKFMCARRGLTVPPSAVRQVMIDLLYDWRVANPAGTSSVKQRKTRGTVVLGTAILGAYADDHQRTILPRWLTPAPIRAGEKKQGKLSADQWRSLCTVHLVITLIRLWGHESPESRWHQMLINFIELVQAVELGSTLVTSAKHANAYTDHITRYLVTLKGLYKEAAIVPNHHLSMHVPDYLPLWGPSPDTRGFGWERFNHYLQQMNTNNRFGDIEKAYMYTTARASNLISLLYLDKMKAIISNTYSRLSRIINPEGRGSGLHDLIGEDGPKSEEPHPSPARSGTIGDDVLLSLATLLNAEPSPVTYTPATLSFTRNESEIFLHASVKILQSVKVCGHLYRPFTRARGDSHVIISHDSPCGLTYRPARLKEVFIHEREIQGRGIVAETLCTIQYLRPLPTSAIDNDFFRKLGSVGGSLWSPDYEVEATVIRPSSIKCHFACTAMELSGHGLGDNVLHVLPLDRVQRHLEAVGDRRQVEEESEEFGVTYDLDDMMEEEEAEDEEEAMDIDSTVEDEY